MDRNKKELQRDLAYLSRLWQVVVRRIKKLKSPAEIYQESDMITRTIRDTFTSDIDTIWVDEPTAFEHAQEFLQIVMPRYASRIKLYDGTEPLFHKYGIEDEIARIQQRHVPLPHGGSIVIEQTEALVAIDVNSGNFRADNNAEETAYQMNLQAAKEIARQLRLRDLGGVIVNDFIDMRDEKHRRGVEKALRDAVKRDRARTKILQDLAVRPHRDDPAAHPAVAEAQRLPGLPALPGHRPGQDVREHEHRRDAHAAARRAPRERRPASRSAWPTTWPITCSTRSARRSPSSRRADMQVQDHGAARRCRRRCWSWSATTATTTK